jgi:hypothetical protein
LKSFSNPAAVFGIYCRACALSISAALCFAALRVASSIDFDLPFLDFNFSNASASSSESELPSSIFTFLG